MRIEDLKMGNEINNRITHLEGYINKLDKISKGEVLEIFGNFQSVIISDKDERKHIYKYLMDRALKEKEELEERFKRL